MADLYRQAHIDNAVGYACGRFNEIYNEITGYKGMKYKELNCNARDFITRGKKIGLKVSNVPTLGGIMVWKNIKTNNGVDGAGHVAVVERINSRVNILFKENVISKIKDQIIFRDDSLKNMAKESFNKYLQLNDKTVE